MIEIIVRDYLEDALDGTDVLCEIPATRPDEFVVIEKTGSSVLNHITTSTVAIQSYAQTMYEAALLNQSVIEAMEDLITETNVSKVVLNSDYNYTDTRTKEYRYQAVFNITHM